MRVLASLIGLAAACVAAPAAAQDWYTISPETTEIRIAMEGPGPRVWLRWPPESEAIPEEMRLLIDVNCEQQRTTLLEARRYDLNNQQTAVQDGPDAEFTMPFSALLITAACHFRAAPERTVLTDASVTSTSVRDAFLSSDEALKTHAIEQVLSEPGAFTPLTFSHLAKELLERGRREDALRWYAFGYIRMLTDLRAGISLEEGYAMMGGVYYRLYGAYRVQQELEAMSTAERRALLNAAVVQDAAVPRIYPVDWFASNQADDVAWGAPGVVHPGSDFLLRERLDDVRRQLGAEVEQAP